MSYVRHIWNATLVAVVFTTALVAASPTWAATVQSANDFPSSLEAGALANHRVLFTTTHELDEGDTLSLSFSSSFSATGITEDDVDILVNNVQQTTASSCAGAEEFSVVRTGNQIDFVPCAGDGGALVPGDDVSILVGTNATSSGTGSGQITNPADPGTYYVTISWQSGGVTESGSIALPITDDGAISVSADVGAGDPGPGGGGGPDPESCGDTTQPVISDLIVSGVSPTSVLISWTTNESSTSFVDYGVSSPSEAVASDVVPVTSHAITLSGLTEGIAYQARARSLDTCLNEGISSVFTFTPADTVLPIISNVQVVDITRTSARVTWETNEPANSRVDFGLTNTYGAFQNAAPFVVSHSILLTGLTEGATYHFFVTSDDPSGNRATSSDATFTLLSDLPPANVILSVTAGNTQNTLSWVNPIEPDFAGVRILRCLGGYASGPVDGSCVVIYTGTGTTTIDAGLTNGTTYFYSAYAFDLAGQFASGALGVATPTAPEEEVLPDDREDPGSHPSCGDGVCDATESAVSCPTDCHPVIDEEVPEDVISPPDIEIPPTTIGNEELVPETDVLFFVAAGMISLEPTLSKEVMMLGNRPLRVVLLDQRITKPVTRVELLFGANRYALSQVPGEGYVADIVTPVAPGQKSLAVVIYYTDETLQSLSFTANLQSDGYSFEVVDGRQNVVGGVTATLFMFGEAWNATPYGQFNPIVTGNDGEFAWYVPNGTYEVRVSHEGYESASSGTLLVSNHLIRPAIRIVLIEALPSVAEVFTPSEFTQFLDAPEVEEVATLATPVAVTALTVGAVALATTPGFLPFLQYLFTSPFLFFARRRRKGYGVVYNAISKMPLDLASVRLFRLPDDIAPNATLPAGRLVQSRVTDKGGRYFFLATPGLYRLTAQKNGFIFPSDTLLRVKDDGTYLDVYHGEAITVSDNDAVIAANIPLDPTQAEVFHAPASIVRARILRRFQNVLALFGVLLSVGIAVVHPVPFTIGLAVLQIVVFLFTKRLVAPKKPQHWGIVYDRSTKRPLSNVIVRIFEPTYNKLLETIVTDSRGRYTALLGPNNYYSVYERPGYDRVEIRPIDYTKNKEPKEFSERVELSPKTPPPTV